MNSSNLPVQAASSERMLTFFRELSSIVSLEHLLHRVIEVAAELTDAELAGLLLHDDSASVLRCTATSLHGATLLDIPVPLDHSIAGAAFVSGQPVLVDDAARDPRYFKAIEDQLDLKARTLLAVPLQYLQQRVGVLEVANKRSGLFDQNDVETLLMLASQAAITIENVRLFQLLHQSQDQLEQLIDQRDAELEHIDEQLQDEIAERRQAESELRKLFHAVENSASTIIITDATPRIEYANPAFTRITGYTLDEVRGKNPRFLKSGRHPREFYDDLWATLLRGEVWRGEFINRKKNGELYHEASRIIPVPDAEGRVTHYIAEKDDVTDRKRSEEALFFLNERLKILREIDQAILGAQSPSSIARAGLGRLSQLMPVKRTSVIELGAGGASELLALEAARGFSLDVTHWLKDIYSLAGQQPRIQGAANLHTLPYRTPLQNQLYAEGLRAYLIAPLLDQEQVIGVLLLESDQANVFTPDHVNLAAEVAGMLAVALRQAQLRASLALRTHELEAQNAELDAYAHTVAHDLKNPLGVVATYSQLLSKYADQFDPDQLKQAAQAAADGALKAVDIVNNLLLLASANKQAVELKPLNMPQIVAEAQRRLKNVLAEYQPEIIWPQIWPDALGHAPWIEEVWVNYLSNAMKYGGRPPRLEVGGELLPLISHSDAVPQQVRFWVRDNGRGLDAEECARLFTPFERLSQVKVGGYGLGLSIVKRIVEKQGGAVGVESASGQGSTFYFTLLAAFP